VSVSPSEQRDRPLAGRRVAFVGKLAGMSRRVAEELVRQHGGTVAVHVDADTELVVVSDETADGQAIAAAEAGLEKAARVAWQEGRLELLCESELWARLGLVDAGQDVKRLYTPVMLAELVHVPVRAVRHWYRQGHLRAERNVGRLPYFHFAEVSVVQRLAELRAAGCSLSQIDRKLAELTRLQPESPRPLAEASVVVAGRCLYVRRGEQLTEPNGQLVLDFAAYPVGIDASGQGADAVAIIPISTGSRPKTAAIAALGDDDLRSLADDFEQCGELERAIEVYRAILMSGEITAEDHFSLADLLYQSGDLTAARERYYAAIELDENYVEARANLGCLLVEQGEFELAEAALRGALEYHPDFADAHYHLARLLDSQDQTQAASRHWEQFLDLAPASPWAEEALDRTGLKASP